MNKMLLSHRPKDSTAEEFEKAWNNSSYCLEALYKALVVLKQENENVKKDDFDCPNHYAKLAFQAGMNKAYDTIISMLPDSAK